MDQGLKERLVGAAVLVAIAVWLIPWVLDGPDDPIDSGSSSLQLPAAEEPVPMRTQTLRLGGAAEEPAVADDSTTGSGDSESAAADTATAVAAPSATVAAAKPTETTAPPSAPAATTPEPRAAAVAAPAPRPAATPAASGDWAVQLGSFGDEDNARRLAQRASTFGYKASVSSHRSGGRTLYRVRVGPFESRSQADATASALAAHGLPGQVVAAD
jgi:DedD protein